jgi:hypothetical protein
LLIYPNEERKPLHLGQIIIYPSSQWGFQPFLVRVPMDLKDEHLAKKIRRLLDIYKFTGTNYIIEYY